MGNENRLSRRGFLAASGAATLGAVALGGLGAPRAAAASRVSYVDTSRSRYDKLTLMVKGQPFFHSGVQFRYEKHKYSNGWTDAQLEPVLKMISDDGFSVVNIPIWWSQVESSKDVFSWTDINRYIDWCRKYGLKLELLWFGHESTGITIASRLPAYAMSDYQLVLTSDGTPLTLSGNHLLDKTDPRLLSREKYVLGRLMAHVASYDSQGTMAGIQVLNEPNVANMQWGASSDRSYSTYSTDRWNSGGYTSASQFRKDVLLDYLTQLGGVVKQSNHSIYTRTNVVGDAAPVAENEMLRAAGTATIDFFGGDPYTTDHDQIYAYGTDATWSQGKNFPMIMETYAGASTTDVLKFTGLAGNAVFNLYAALDPDAPSGSSSDGLYDFDPATKVVTRKAVSGRVADLNHMLNKISRDLASRTPVGAGGSSLQMFNHPAAAKVSMTRQLDDALIGFTTTSSAQGIAVKRGMNELVLLSTRQATFGLPGSLAAGGSMEVGYYDGNDRWVRTGAKPYTETGGTTSVEVSAGECVRVLHIRMRGQSDQPVSGATYKVKNAASGRYLDSDADGAVLLAMDSSYDDQEWTVEQQPDGTWTIKNARSGRFYLEAQAADNAVVWNSGEVTASASWRIEPVPGHLGFRLKNNYGGRDYMYVTPAGDLQWNTGAKNPETVWVFEQG